MHHFKAFDMINLQYEIRIWKKILNKATSDKTSILSKLTPLANILMTILRNIGLLCANMHHLASKLSVFNLSFV